MLLIVKHAQFYRKKCCAPWTSNEASFLVYDVPGALETDSRSVREAIEHNTLTQALSPQWELQTLVETVTEIAKYSSALLNHVKPVLRWTRCRRRRLSGLPAESHLQWQWANLSIYSLSCTLLFPCSVLAFVWHGGAAPPWRLFWGWSFLKMTETIR